MTSQKTVRMRNIEEALSIQLAGGPGRLSFRWRHYNVEAMEYQFRSENLFKFKRCLKRAVAC